MRKKKLKILQLAILAMLIIPMTLQASEPHHALKRLLVTGKCNGCNLRRVDLSGKQLSDAQLRWADLREARLENTILDRADLTGANLEGAKVIGGSFRGSIMQGANLRRVALHEMALSGSDLRWSDLSHLNVDLDLEFVDLLGVLLEGARFQGGVRCARLPEKGGWGCTAESE